MKKGMVLPFVLATVAGCFWSLGSNAHLVVAHLVAPICLGVTAAILLVRRRMQVVLLSGWLLWAELIRLLLYTFLSEGWHYITEDTETQIFLLASFLFQSVVAFGAWGCRSIIRPDHSPSTASPNPCELLEE